MSVPSEEQVQGVVVEGVISQSRVRILTRRVQGSGQEQVQRSQVQSDIKPETVVAVSRVMMPCSCTTQSLCSASIGINQEALFPVGCFPATNCIPAITCHSPATGNKP